MLAKIRRLCPTAIALIVLVAALPTNAAPDEEPAGIAIVHVESTKEAATPPFDECASTEPIHLTYDPDDGGVGRMTITGAADVCGWGAPGGLFVAPSWEMMCNPPEGDSVSCWGEKLLVTTTYGWIGMTLNEAGAVTAEGGSCTVDFDTGEQECTRFTMDGHLL